MTCRRVYSGAAQSNSFILERWKAQTLSCLQCSQLIEKQKFARSNQLYCDREMILLALTGNILTYTLAQGHVIY